METVPTESAQTPESSKQQHQTPIEIIKRYAFEVLEAFVAILVIKIAMEKPIEMRTLLWESAVIGLLTFILESVDPQFNSSMRQGMTFTVGSQIMARHFI
jgi:hypothetical protein